MNVNIVKYVIGEIVTKQLIVTDTLKQVIKMARTRETELEYANWLNEVLNQGIIIKNTYPRKLYRRIAIQDYVNKITITSEMAHTIQEILFNICGIKRVD